MLSKDPPGSLREGPFGTTSSSVLGSNTKHSSLTRTGLLSYDLPQKHMQAQAQSGRRRSTSPGSEMVTLEEFLEESNTTSPVNVSRLTREEASGSWFALTGIPWLEFC